MKTIPELKIIECLATSTNAMTTAKLLDETGIAKTTLNRLLTKLVDTGYVERLGHGLYGIGPALSALATSVVDNQSSYPFNKLLHNLSEKTGLNCELYSLRTPGPRFLMHVSGRSEFQVKMFPGWQLKSYKHPATVFYFLEHPEQTSLWGWGMENIEKQNPDWYNWRSFMKEHPWYLEKGTIRPELARICIKLKPGYCLGLSGLISEMEEIEDQIVNIVREEIQGVNK